jgi:hypothetical protein
MEARISITTTKGIVYEGVAALSAANGSPKDLPQKQVKGNPDSTTEIDELQFALPVRPFIKKYAGGMSGSKRLTLLVAHTAKGKPGTPIECAQVQKLWGSMKTLMGSAYNPVHVSRARDQGWIDSPKSGTLVLLAGWKEIVQ